MAVDISGVAKYQKVLLWLVLLHIIIMVANIWVGRAAVAAGETPDPSLATINMLVGLVALIVAISSIVVIVLLMTALDRPLISKILAAIAMFIPLVGLIVLLFVNHRATSTLRSAGYKVGLMGASGGPSR